MNTLHIVIEIPEEVYKKAKETHDVMCDSVWLGIKNGTPLPKVGHWIKLDNCSNSGYYCSECQKRVVKEGWSDTVKIIKYCPNCGAKMGGEQKKCRLKQ